jgi:hypothetical protein
MLSLGYLLGQEEAAYGVRLAMAGAAWVSDFTERVRIRETTT